MPRQMKADSVFLGDNLSRKERIKALKYFDWPFVSRRLAYRPFYGRGRQQLVCITRFRDVVMEKRDVDLLKRLNWAYTVERCTPAPPVKSSSEEKKIPPEKRPFIIKWVKEWWELVGVDEQHKASKPKRGRPKKSKKSTK